MSDQDYTEPDAEQAPLAHDPGLEVLDSGDDD